jgi:hypothetical protein
MKYFIVGAMAFLLAGCLSQGPTGPQGEQGPAGTAGPRHDYLEVSYDIYEPYNSLKVDSLTLNDTVYMKFETGLVWGNYPFMWNIQDTVKYPMTRMALPEILINYSAADTLHAKYVVGPNCKLYKSASASDLKSVTAAPAENDSTRQGMFQTGEIYFLKNSNNYWTKFKILNMTHFNSGSGEHRLGLLIEYYFYQTTSPDFSLYKRAR